jgi:hypothetical protein
LERKLERREVKKTPQGDEEQTERGNIGQTERGNVNHAGLTNPKDDIASKDSNEPQKRIEGSIEKQIITRRKP